MKHSSEAKHERRKWCNSFFGVPFIKLYHLHSWPLVKKSLSCKLPQQLYPWFTASFFFNSILNHPVLSATQSYSRLRTYTMPVRSFIILIALMSIVLSTLSITNEMAEPRWWLLWLTYNHLLTKTSWCKAKFSRIHSCHFFPGISSL